MKIGIFISGQLRLSPEKTDLILELLSSGFPGAEFAYCVWDYDYANCQALLDNLDNVEIVEDFSIDYSPYEDNPTASEHYQYKKKLKNPNERHLHQTKQILLHDKLVQKYGSKYDVIVRCRWDTVVSPIIDFTKYAEKVYSDPCVMSICTRSDYWDTIIHIGENHGSHYPFIKHRDRKTGKITEPKCFDMFLDIGLILHRYEDWNSELVQRLHNEKKLLAAEFGWWQVMVNGTKHNQWAHYDGGASIYRSVNRKDRELIEKLML